MAAGIALIARRKMKASARRVFDAWTQPEQLRAWWGPRPVTCASAEVDLRVGGRYRIVNAMPDGSHVTIEGVFRVVEPPHELVYTWTIDDGPKATSLVTVKFQEHGDETEVVIVHEDIASDEVKRSHESGWTVCLEGLERYFTPE